MNRSKRISLVVLAGILAASLSVTAFADNIAANAETSSLVATNAVSNTEEPDAAILDEDTDYAPESLYGIDDQDAGAVAFAITGDEVKAASTSSDFTLYLKFGSAIPFSVKAYIKLTSGIEKLYTIEGSGKNAESWFPMQDMFDALHITADEIDRIEFDGDANFKGANFTNTHAASGKDENPATSVGLVVVPMLASCAAMMFFKKRK